MKARENPFRIEQILKYRYVFSDGLSLAGFVERFEAVGRRGAIVGPKGHGKTTLLEDVADYLTARGERVMLLRLSRENRSRANRLCRDSLLTAPTESVILVDGAEQLKWTQWARFKHHTRRHRGLLITLHRPGRLNQLIQCRTSPQLLADIVRQIAPATFEDLADTLPDLFHQHSGNARECLRALYDLQAARP